MDNLVLRGPWRERLRKKKRQREGIVELIYGRPAGGGFLHLVYISASRGEREQGRLPPGPWGTRNRGRWRQWEAGGVWQDKRRPRVEELNAVNCSQA